MYKSKKENKNIPGARNVSRFEPLPISLPVFGCNHEMVAVQMAAGAAIRVGADC